MVPLNKVGPSLGRRLGTILPEISSIIHIDMDQLTKMADVQLIKFASEMLGVVLPSGTPRRTILNRIVNLAMLSKD